MIGKKISAFLLHVLISIVVAYLVAALIGGSGDSGLIAALLITVMLQLSFVTTVVLLRKPERRR